MTKIKSIISGVIEELQAEVRHESCFSEKTANP
jgi:hypothetical protein